MNALVRTVARRTSIGLGALALAVGAAACGGDDGQEPAPEQDPGVEETAPEDGEQLEPSDGDEQRSDGGGEAAGDSAASDGGGDAEELSERDLDDAKQRWVDFIHAIDDGDGETACGYLLDPETGEIGDEDPECAELFSQHVAPQVESGEYGDLDTSMVDAEDNGDGTVTILLNGEPFPLVMSQDADGEWYATANI